MSILRSFSQNVVVDTNNTSSVNLAGGTTFTGAPTSTLGVNAIQVSLHADQNCTVYVDQSPGSITGEGTVTTNGTTTLAGSSTRFLRDFAIGDTISVSGETNRIVATIVSDISLTVTSAFSTSSGGLAYTYYPWDIKDDFEYNNVAKNFGVTVQAINSYVRVRVKNEAASSTTEFRLQTVLCPIANSEPRRVDREGNFATSIQDIEDQFTGQRVWQGDFHDLRTNGTIRLAGIPFTSTTKDTNFWAETVGGTGTVSTSAVPGTVVLNTGAAAGSAQYQTVRIARRIPGHENTCRMILKVGDTGTGGNTRQWGPYDANNGYFFQLSGTTFNIVSRTGTSDTAVAQANWNYNNVFALTTNFHTYEIRMSSRRAFFYIDGELVHSIAPAATMPTQTLNLPVTLYNNGGNNLTLSASQAYITRTGPLTSEAISKNITTATTTVCKYSAGRLHKIIIGNAVNGSITIYDNTSAAGTIISTLTLVSATPQPNVIEFDCPYNTGLTIVTSSAVNITVIYE